LKKAFFDLLQSIELILVKESAFGEPF